MAVFSLNSLAYAFLASASLVSAQSNSGDDVRVWAAVAYINHGDKTPWIGSVDEVLVPEGAQQLWRQGTAFRARYLNQTSGSSSDKSLTVFDSAPIHQIESVAFNHSQVNVVSAEDEWVVAGALAFMQGLYPPASGSVANMEGGEDMARNMASNASDLIDYPFDGYQYPMLQTLSSHNSDSPGVQGTVGCSNWINETNAPFRERDDMKTMLNDTLDFYKNLLSSSPLAGGVTPGYTNIWNAYEIYEWVRYMYTHNETVFEGLENANETLAELETNAYTLARAKLAKGWEESDDDTDAVLTVPGRTLAKTIADQLKSNIAWGGSREKLSLMFGSYQPMLSFLSIAGVLNRENLLSGPLTRFPGQGAAIIVELISDADADSDTMPDDSELRVRFYYRENADPETTFESYSLLNSGLGGETIPYQSFSRAMNEEGLTSSEWCTVCDSRQAPWCPASSSSEDTCSDSDGSGMYGPDSGRLHPALAGLIGAAVLSGILGVVAAALYVFGGFRLRRGGPKERSSSMMGGGFKGPEKKPGDPDVEVSRGGGHHERVGSWELRDGHVNTHPTDVDASGGAGIVTKKPSRTAISEVSGWREDDEVSLVGATPVTARESI